MVLLNVALWSIYLLVQQVYGHVTMHMESLYMGSMSVLAVPVLILGNVLYGYFKVGLS